MGMTDPAPLTDGNIIGRIMDKAASADRRALFAGLQAALSQITDMKYGGATAEDAFREIERRLDLGMEYGGEFLQAQGSA